MFPGVVYVIDAYNVPGPTGHSVRLRWRGLPPQLTGSIGAPTAFRTVMGACVLLGVIVAVIHGNWACASAATTMLLVTAMLGSSRVPPAHCAEVTWEARDRELRIHHGSAIPFLGREDVVPFDQIDLVEFEVGSQGHAEVGLLCRVIPKMGPMIDLPMTVGHVDTQAKAVDLALRVGAAMGLPGYRVTRCTPRSIRVQLERDGTPIPFRDDDPSYELEHDESVAPLPAFQIAPFHPESYRGPFRLVTWEPGRLVLFERPGPSLPARIVACLLAGALGHLGGIIVVEVMSTVGLTHHPMSDWRVWTMTALGLVGGWVGIHLFWGDTSVAIDWTTRRFARRDGLGRWEREFAEVHEVLLRGRSTAVQPRGVPKWAWCWCEVILRVGLVDLVIPSTRFRGDPEAPYEMMLPMAVDLARALGLPWRWHEDITTSPRA